MAVTQRSGFAVLSLTLLAYPSQTAAQHVPAAPIEASESKSSGPNESTEFLELPLTALLDIEVTVTAPTKTIATSAEEAPAIIYVVSRREIEQHGYASIGEALAQVPGLFVIDDHVTANVSIRGIHAGPDSWSRTVKVMIDGQSAHDYATGGTLLGPEFIPMTVVDHIEVIAGPGSALYGANAFLGVINVVTREATDGVSGSAQVDTQVNGARAFGGGGSGRFALRTQGAYPIEFQLAAAAAQFDRSGLQVPDSSPAAELYSGQISEDDKSRPRTAFAKFGWGLGRAGRISILSNYQVLDANAQFVGEAPLSRAARHARANWLNRFEHEITIFERSNPGAETHGGAWANLACLGRPIPQQLNLHTWASWTKGRNLATERHDRGQADLIHRRNRSIQTLELGTELTYRIGSSSALVGVNYLKSHFAGDEVFDIDRRTEAQTRRNHPTPWTLANFGAYGQLIMVPMERLRLTAGLRWNQADQWGRDLNTRLALTLRAFRRVYFKLLYGSSFVPPSPTQLAAVPLTTTGVKGNPDLESQRARTHEAAVVLRPLEHLRFELNLFRTVIEGRVEFVQRGSLFVAANMTSSQSLGGSVLASTNWKYGWLDADLSLQKTTVADPRVIDFTWELTYGREALGGRAAPNYPTVIGRIRGGFRWPKLHFMVGASGMLVGSRKSSVANIKVNRASYLLDPYFKLDAHIRTLGLSLFEGRETVLSLHGDNLTNTAYAHGGARGVDIPARAITLTFSLRQEF